MYEIDHTCILLGFGPCSYFITVCNILLDFGTILYFSLCSEWKISEVRSLTKTSPEILVYGLLKLLKCQFVMIKRCLLSSETGPQISVKKNMFWSILNHISFFKILHLRFSPKNCKILILIEILIKILQNVFFWTYLEVFFT